MRKQHLFNNNWGEKIAEIIFSTENPYEKAVFSDCVMQAYQFLSGFDSNSMSQKDAEVPQKYAETGAM